MKSTDLIRDQVDELLAEGMPMFGLLSQLSARIAKQGMRIGPLTASVLTAQHARHRAARGIIERISRRTLAETAVKAYSHRRTQAAQSSREYQ